MICRFGGRIGSNSIAIPAHVTSHDGKRIPVTAAFYRARSPWTLRFSALRYALARFVSSLLLVWGYDEPEIPLLRNQPILSDKR